ELSTIGRNLRDQLEEVLVHAPELLRPHVAPVDAHEARLVAQPREPEDGGRQVLVRQLRRVERGTLTGAGEAGQRRQPAPWLAGGEAAEDDLRALPEIAESIVRTAAHGAVPQPAHAVALGVERARRVG